MHVCCFVLVAVGDMWDMWVGVEVSLIHAWLGYACALWFRF